MKNATDYFRLFQSLLPRGKAWNLDEDSILASFLKGLADEFARVESRANDLLTERDTRYTTELITDHEIDLGIPDECSELAETLQQRRSIVHAKLTAIGRQDKQYYIDLMATFGYTVTITEFAADTFKWQVNMEYGDEWIYFRSGGSESGDPLIYAPGIELLNCVLQRYKPAHTTLQVIIEGPEFDRGFGPCFASLPSDSHLEGGFGRCFDVSFDVRYGGGFEFTAFGDGFDRPE